MFTQETLNEMITCPKVIADEPRKAWSTLHGSRRNNFRMTDGQNRKYSVYIRISTFLPEEFSVGMTHIQPDGVHLLLVRFNGPHVAGEPCEAEWHNHHHIHTVDAKRLAEGFRKLPPGVISDAFSGWRQAITAFMSHVGAPDASKIFGAEVSQPRFPRFEEDWANDD